MGNSATNSKSVEIEVRVECRPSTKGDGAWWDIVEIVDERKQWQLGDSGVYEFDAERGLPDAVMQYVLGVLEQGGEFNDPEASYFVDVRFCDIGTELGRSSMRFSGRQTSDWQVGKEK